MRLKKKVLITGIYGQDGILLSKILKKRKIKIYGIVKKKILKNHHLLNNNKIKIFENNLENTKSLKKIITKIKPDILINLASKNVNATTQTTNKKFYKYNYQIFKNLINTTIKINNDIKIINIGSSRMFDFHNSKIINEKTPFNSISNYGLFRISCHEYLLKLSQRSRINFCTVILFNHESKYRNKNFLLPRIIKSINDKDYDFIRKIYRENIKLDVSHAEDICRGIAKIAFSNKKIEKVILSSGKLTKINSLINFLLKIKKLKLNKLPIPKNNKKFYLGKSLYMEKHFKFYNKKNILSAIKEMALFR